MDYKDYKKLVIRKKKHLDKIKNEFSELLKECPHEELEMKSVYYDGSYYDKAITTHFNQCKLCGKTIEVKTDTHSWYG